GRSRKRRLSLEPRVGRAMAGPHPRRERCASLLDTGKAVLSAEACGGQWGRKIIGGRSVDLLSTLKRTLCPGRGEGRMSRAALSLLLLVLAMTGSLAAVSPMRSGDTPTAYDSAKRGEIVEDGAITVRAEYTGGVHMCVPLGPGPGAPLALMKMDTFRVV